MDDGIRSLLRQCADYIESKYGDDENRIGLLFLIELAAAAPNDKTVEDWQADARRYAERCFYWEQRAMATELELLNLKDSMNVRGN